MKPESNRFGAAEIASDIAARNVSGTWGELVEHFGAAIVPWVDRGEFAKNKPSDRPAPQDQHTPPCEPCHGAAS